MPSRAQVCKNVSQPDPDQKASTPLPPPAPVPPFPNDSRPSLQAPRRSHSAHPTSPPTRASQSGRPPSARHRSGSRSAQLHSDEETLGIPYGAMRPSGEMEREAGGLRHADKAQTGDAARANGHGVSTSNGHAPPASAAAPPPYDLTARQPPILPILRPEYRYCRRCELVRPPRAHHCRACGTVRHLLGPLLLLVMTLATAVCAQV
jgi:palmitoyltransferase